MTTLDNGSPDWILLKTTDDDDVAINLDEVKTIWNGREDGTIVIERMYSVDPIVVIYPSVKKFCEEYLDHFDERPDR